MYRAFRKHQAFRASVTWPACCIISVVGTIVISVGCTDVPGPQGLLDEQALVTLADMTSAPAKGVSQPDDGSAEGDTPPAAADGEPLAAGSFVSGRLLVKFRPERAAEAAQLLGRKNAHVLDEIPGIRVKIVELPPQASETAELNAFRQRAEVQFAELDRLVPPDTTPNDPYYANSWHLPVISAPTAWDTTTGSSSVIIAILDTGCDPTHPDLAPKYVAGWNVYDDNADTSDVYGHGTAVAGVAGAASDNGIGVASPAWECGIMPIRISGPDGSASFSRAASGLIWAADHGARVANISYRMSTSLTVTSAADYIEQHGGVVTISAGNYGDFDSSNDNPHVLTVSATDQTDTIATWSTTGNNVDLAAPGASIYVTADGGGYGAGSGTSFSAPLVAGVAAIAISANPSLTGVEIQDIITQSADDLGPAGWDTDYGWGRLNAAAAVAMASADPPSSDPPTTKKPPGHGHHAVPTDMEPPVISIIAPAEGETVGNRVDVAVEYSDNVGVDKVELYVDGQREDTSRSAPFETRWNSRQAADGPHTLECRAYDAAGNSAWSDAITVYK